MRTSDRAAHRWLNAPNTQLRRAVSNFYRGDARQSDGTAMPSRAGDSQYPPTPPKVLFFSPYFLFLRRSHHHYDAQPILLSGARFGFRCACKSRLDHHRRKCGTFIRDL